MQREGTTTRKGGIGSAGRAKDHEDEKWLLPGPGLGGGPVWRLPAGKEVPEHEGSGDEALLRCRSLLEQALSCSEHADVRFVFDDGESRVHGHRGMLCCVSGEFGAMFGSEWAEAKSGEVRVRGVERASFRGFLEFLYLGRAGKEMGQADGREVWMLADLYDVRGVKEWLMGKGLTEEGVCAAAQFALEGGGFQAQLLEACKALGSSRKRLCGAGEKGLRGVSAEAAGVVLEALLECGCACDEGTDPALVRQEGGDVGRAEAEMVEGFKFVEQWARANGGLGHGSAGVASLVALINLGGICPRDVLHIVGPSGLLGDGKADNLYRARMRGGGLEGRRLGVVMSFSAVFQSCLAASAPGYGQRVAISHPLEGLVHVYDAASGARVLSVGSREEDPERLACPYGVAFSGGELVVADQGHKRVCVFDGAGRLLREMGRSGDAHHRLKCPCGVAVGGGGDIIVSDIEGHCVVVYRADGTFVRSIGSYGDGDDAFVIPAFVATGPDGRILVSDSGFRSPRVQVLGAEGGRGVTIGSKGSGEGQFMMPWGVAASAHGEILVTDTLRHDMQLFSAEGAPLGCFGGRDVCGVAELRPRAVCVDAWGRVFVCNGDEGEVLMLA